MSKITITIEDVPGEGVIIVGEPSMQELGARLRSRQQLTIAQRLAMAAWMAIADQAKHIGNVSTGERQ